MLHRSTVYAVAAVYSQVSLWCSQLAVASGVLYKSYAMDQEESGCVYVIMFNMLATIMVKSESFQIFFIFHSAMTRTAWPILGLIVLIWMRIPCSTQIAVKIWIFIFWKSFEILAWCLYLTTTWRGLMCTTRSALFARARLKNIDFLGIRPSLVIYSLFFPLSNNLPCCTSHYPYIKLLTDF